MKPSVLLLTHNEKRNLPRCLDALRWCDDIVIVDSNSTDDTVSIARSRGVRVLSQPFIDFASQRNFGLAHGNFKNEWVLHLDADEIVTSEFREALELCEPSPHVDAYHVPSKLMLFGRWLRYSGMYPVYQVRLGRRDVLKFKQVGHGQREDLAPERIAVFEAPYLHYSFSNGLAEWFRRHVRYAQDEAVLLARTGAEPDGWRSLLAADPVRRRRALKGLSKRIPPPLRSVLRFLHVYLVRGGFRDGPAGLTFAMMMAVYEGMTAVLIQEIRREAA